MTSLRPFVLGLAATFFVPWLVLIVIPHSKMKAQAAESWQASEDGPVLTFPAGAPNIFRQGQQIYAAEGCASCHTQMIRPTSIGEESWRPGFGKGTDPLIPVHTRETVAGDYDGEEFAFLGASRVGPDLSNVGYRYDEAWHHKHLFAPTSVRDFSTMPSFRHLYDVRAVRGQPSAEAIVLGGEFAAPEGYEVVPTEKARTLVAYLMTLKKDATLPPAKSIGESASNEASGDVK